MDFDESKNNKTVIMRYDDPKKHHAFIASIYDRVTDKATVTNELSTPENPSITH